MVVYTPIGTTGDATFNEAMVDALDCCALACARGGSEYSLQGALSPQDRAVNAAGGAKQPRHPGRLPRRPLCRWGVGRALCGRPSLEIGAVAAVPVTRQAVRC
jgi:hypothetical protein